MIQLPKESPLQKIKISRVVLPTILGLGVVAYFIVKNVNPEVLKSVNFTSQTTFWLIVAALLMVIRDLGYVLRIRVLTDNNLSWLQSIRVIMLWEFTSAITPSAIGGTSVAILYVNKEGIGIGKSSAVVMATSLLDELYFVLIVPIIIIFISFTDLFSIGGGLTITNPYLLAALIGYSLKFIWVLIISYALFKNPRGFKWLLLQVFRLPFLKKWRLGAHKAGDEIIVSSVELKKKPFRFWLKAFGATIMSWTSRYWVVNALFLAFFTVNDQFLLFARQLVMWIIMLVSPTPGGSGITEYVFTEYLADFLPYTGIAILLALLWRLYTYYPYLIIGAIIFPRWIKLKFPGKSNKPN